MDCSIFLSVSFCAESFAIYSFASLTGTSFMLSVSDFPVIDDSIVCMRLSSHTESVTTSFLSVVLTVFSVKTSKISFCIETTAVCIHFCTSRLLILSWSD